MPDIFSPLDYPIIFIQPDRITLSAWVEHVPFGMFLIDLLRPKTVVELGTHTGVSYCAFCQAVKELEMDSKCFAVDTWQGDKHSSLYGPEVLDDLRAHHDPPYGQFSTLMQCTFDEAVQSFADASIDLLHIDGLHTYEAVKRDFETWFPKLSPQAVVVFHDTVVHERDFGVWRLWDELALKYPSFEFMHGHGLGILAVGNDYPASLNILLKSTKANEIREFFHQAGASLEKDLKIQNQVSQIAKQEFAQQALEEKVTRMASELDQANREIVNYALSTSWRMTRPFRKIMQRIKKKI